MNKLIFVLEDNQEILNIITMVLKENYQIIGAETVSEFYALLPTLRPALCLLDVMLPDGNGLEVCQKIKAAPETAHISAIIMTASSQIAKMKEASCADDYIAKPFDIDDLEYRIAGLIP